jgi:hypothetical protein
MLAPQLNHPQNVSNYYTLNENIPKPKKLIFAQKN